MFIDDNGELSIHGLHGKTRSSTTHLQSIDSLPYPSRSPPEYSNPDGERCNLSIVTAGRKEATLARALFSGKGN